MISESGELSRTQIEKNFSCQEKEFGFYLKGNKEPRGFYSKEGADVICILGRSLLLQLGLD